VPPVLTPLGSKKSIRTTCATEDLLPIVILADHPPPLTTAGKTSETAVPIEAVVGTGDIEIVGGGIATSGGVGVGRATPRPKPGSEVTGIDAKSPVLKFNASIATGISEDTVNNAGKAGGAGETEKNSFRNLESCA
jgi:hypothetical protein